MTGAHPVIIHESLGVYHTSPFRFPQSQGSTAMMKYQLNKTIPAAVVLMLLSLLSSHVGANIFDTNAHQESMAMMQVARRKLNLSSLLYVCPA
ncbi:hypothetical protein OUZ56_028828 [Daphnia magna]|uniref:Uncharacterized protein n=1 Tax=Daphnia magna TaxID=35525 RepID=A0ABR0B518_9CRUS|nr:hypothetical protein OUZ56_028828 [Daphnia magna]